MARLELRGVGKTYRGGIVAARNLDLEVETGAMFVVLGPSGSGKSTLLRLIAGLETLDAGSIHLDGRRIDSLAPRDRDLAMVFQDVVVYPHLDVFYNIAFGLRARRVSRAEIQTRVSTTAALLGLDDLLKRDPTTLSGGQKRRVTLARALVLQPKLLLFDEPFSGLDAPLRASIRAEIADLHRQTGTTTVLVTHDQGEALALADRIAVVDAGRLIQVGPPQTIYEFPQTSFVARFIGQPPMSLIPCTLHPAGPDSLQIQPLDIPPFSPLWLIHRATCPPFDRLATHPDPTVLLGLRAEQITLTNPPGMATATLDRIEPAGHETTLTLRLGPYRLCTRRPGQPPLTLGQSVSLAITLEAASWFDLITGDRIA